MKGVVLILVAFLSGCATTAPKSFYADWIAVENPQRICAGADSCIKRAQYRGKPLCTLVTSDKELDMAQVGVLMNQCLL